AASTLVIGYLLRRDRPLLRYGDHLRALACPNLSRIAATGFVDQAIRADPFLTSSSDPCCLQRVGVARRALDLRIRWQDHRVVAAGADAREIGLKVGKIACMLLGSLLARRGALNIKRRTPIIPQRDF